MPGMASFSSSMAPFLYQTRTIQRQSVAALTRTTPTALLARALHSSQPQRNDAEAQFFEKFATLHDDHSSRSKKKTPKGATRRAARGDEPASGIWSDVAATETSSRGAASRGTNVRSHRGSGSRAARRARRAGASAEDGGVDPWWQVAGLQDPSIEQPPVIEFSRHEDQDAAARFGERRQRHEGEEEASREGAVEGRDDHDVKDREPFGTQGREGHGDGGYEDGARESRSSPADSEADKVWEEYGDGTGQDEPAPPLNAEDGPNLWDDAGWANRASGPMDLPHAPPSRAGGEHPAAATSTTTTAASAAWLRGDFVPIRPSRRTFKSPGYLDEAPPEDVPWDALGSRPAKPATAEEDISDNDYSNAAPIPFDFERGTSEDSIRGTRSPLSTLSRQERTAFSRIWDEIILFNHKPKVKGKLPALKSKDEEEETAAPHAPAIRSEDEVKENSQSAIKFLIKDAAFAAQQGPDPLAGGGTVIDQMRNSRFREQVLMHYPTSVREVAVKAMGLSTMHPGRDGRSRIGLNLADIKNHAEDPDVVLRRIKSMGVVDSQVEQRRQAEWDRIKDMLTSAQTDKALWDVLEEHVFSIPGRLGVDEMISGAGGGLVGGGDASKAGGGAGAVAAPESDQSCESGGGGVQQQTEAPEGQEGETSSEDGEAPTKAQPPVPLGRLPMDVYGPVYPALLIAAHRQLVRNFRPSSPLVFGLLPRVKRISLTSFVLGASTTLYNETMSLWWTHRGDLRAILSMLEEMDAAGLYADSHTEKLLDRINTTLRVCEGGGGWTGFVPSMMKMNGFSAAIRKRMATAHAKVRQSVQQRGIQLLS